MQCHTPDSAAAMCSLRTTCEMGWQTWAGLQLHGRTDAPAGRLTKGAGPVQGAGSGTDAPHDERQIHPSRGGAVPLPRRVAGLLWLLRGPLRPAPPRPVDPSAASRRRLDALEACAHSLRGAVAASARGWRLRPPAAPTAHGGSAADRHSASRCPAPSSPGLASHPSPQPMPLNAVEPPCTDPYARWRGKGGAARLPPPPYPDVRYGPAECPTSDGMVWGSYGRTTQSSGPLNGPDRLLKPSPRFAATRRSATARGTPTTNRHSRSRPMRPDHGAGRNDNGPDAMTVAGVPAWTAQAGNRDRRERTW